MIFNDFISKDFRKQITFKISLSHKLQDANTNLKKKKGIQFLKKNSVIKDYLYPIYPYFQNSLEKRKKVK